MVKATVLTTAEAAEYLGLHPRSVLDLVHQEEAWPGTGIVASNVARNNSPQGRRYRYRLLDLDRFIESRRRAA